MEDADGRFSRSAAILGEDGLARLRAARVLVVGIGGVGSWCCEALVRTGLGTLAFMDDDTVQPSNLNRQLPATVATVGRFKTEALAARLAEIDPTAHLLPMCRRYTSATAVDWRAYDVVADAIDSVADKAALILNATAAGVPVVSSMGAALRRDPTRVRLSPFARVTGDGLARALRQRFRREGVWPTGPVTCVHSEEPPAALPVRGSLMTVTAAFGMALAAAAMDRILLREPAGSGPKAKCVGPESVRIWGGGSVV